MSDFQEGGGRAGWNGEAGAPWCDRSGDMSNERVEHAAPERKATPSFEPQQLEAYAGTGYELIPLHAPDAVDHKDRPIGKAPFRGWRQDSPISVEDARAHMASGQNVGVRLRDIDLILDVDPRNFEDGDDPLARLQKDLAFDAGSYPTVITGSGGKHIYMLKPAEMLLSETLAAYQGIEFKTLGRQVVAAGSVHPDAKQPYLWDDDALAVPLGAVRQAPPRLLEVAHRSSAIGASGGGGERTPEELAVMLDALDVTQFRDQTRWLAIMMACHHATAGDGREEFITWSISDPSFSDQASAIAARWNSLCVSGSEPQVTERTLFKALIDAGRGDLLPRDSAEDDFPDDLPPISEDGAALDPITAKVLEMNRQFCAVLEGGDYSIFMEDMDEVFDPPRRVWTPMSRSAFRFYHENELVALPDQKQRKSVADVWLQHPRMRKYPGIAMDPEGKHPNKLNLWQGWSVEPAPGDWSLTRELIDDVLCAGDAACADYVRRWIAFMLQHPGVRPETAIAFRGSEGTGKSTLGRILMRIAGAHGMTVSSPTQFAGRFNAHLRNIAFLFADEAFWPGDKGAEGTLKQLVTEPVISFEPKGKDIKTGRNLVHLMMASNESWMVPAGVEARRFAVFDVTERRKNDRVFFSRLWAQLDQGGLGGMVHDLMELDLDGWHPAHNPPRTQALAEQKLMSLDPPAKFWFEALDRGELPGVSEAEWLAGSVSLTTERNVLLEDYDVFLKRNRIYSLKASHKALATAGRDFGLVAGKSKGDERAWTLPPLAEARLRFEARIGAQDLFA